MFRKWNLLPFPHISSRKTNIIEHAISYQPWHSALCSTMVMCWQFKSVFATFALESKCFPWCLSMIVFPYDKLFSLCLCFCGVLSYPDILSFTLVCSKRNILYLLRRHIDFLILFVFKAGQIRSGNEIWLRYRVRL